MISNKLHFILLLLILNCCASKNTESIIEFNPNTPHQEEMIDSVEIIIPKAINWSELDGLNQSALIDLQLENNEDLTIDGLSLFAKNLLPRIYKVNKGNFVWNNKKNIDDAYRAFELSYLDGLLVTDYHKAKLDSIKSKILASTVKEQKQALYAKHDIFLTDAMLMYGFHLLIGKVDPASIDAAWNYENRKISKKNIFDFFKLIKNQKLFDGLDQIRPNHLDYRAMMNAMRYYKGIEDQTWETIEVIEKIEVGDTSDCIPIIRERLSLCCHWNESVVDSSVYDSILYAGIVNFQSTHGLDDDGVIGKKTAALLNLTPKQRMEKLKVNLERLRWLEEDLGGYRVEVNIAAFRLFIKQENELIYQCNVVTGKPYHKTPIFTAPMKYVDFNPTWTVPYSIATKELLPKLKKDGAKYLLRNNMELLNRSGKAVDANVINFNDLAIGNFPYIIRQKPGSKNALGVVKFMFPNRYSVYLHDTQSKSLFSKSSRAFSHGCIRVENPLDMAEVLLNDRRKWDRDKIEKVIQTRKTKSVSLKKKVEVMLLYYTAGLNPDGTMFYLPDVYSRDKALLNVIEKPFTFNENTLKRVYPNNEIVPLDSLVNM